MLRVSCAGLGKQAVGKGCKKQVKRVEAEILNNRVAPIPQYLRSAGFLEGVCAVNTQSRSFLASLFKPETLLKLWALVQ